MLPVMQFLSSQPWVERLGWTLVHFLWQGVAIAAVYATARRWMAHSSRPNTRYVLACIALAVMLAAPLVTWILTAPMDAVAVSTHLTDRVPFAASTGVVAPPVSFIETVSRERSAQFLPWVVAMWLAGAIVFWMRLIAGWMAAARVRSTQVRPAPPEWQQTLDRLKARVGVTRPVRLLISALVQTPAVVGWLRPVVLVPIGALAGLPSEQIEALLIHELAHIRRHDYLVNIFQNVAEALLFYHPAVWWVSGHIRTEREMCCDDVAVSLTGDAFTYALALADLEQSRPVHLHAAVAANGGSLANRIGRVLGQSRPASRTLPGTGGMVGAILLVVTACGVFGQTADSPRFDVASIKLNTASFHTGTMVDTHPGGRLTAEFSPVRLLIRRAYGVESFQILGGPEWINTDGYDIEAKAEGDPSQRQLLLMLQSLLEDRFKLKVHRETRELPVYAMTVAKGGLKLPSPKAGGCFTGDPNAPDSSGRPKAVPPGQPYFPCGVAVVMFNSPGPRMLGGQVSTTDLAQSLTSILGRTILDKTGFTGKFDLHLEFALDEALAGLLGPNAPPFRLQERRPGELDSPSIFAALQQQLGLKLESSKGPAEVLVVDHVERPTEN
jgi:uncharacterized protein (TIGR03435 family)